MALLVGGCGSGGAWKQQRADSAGGMPSLISVTFVDAQRGWAVGMDMGSGLSKPVIIATKDGGVSWGAQDANGAGSRGQLNSVAFVDAEHGWAVGNGPSILATDDGGDTWTPQNTSAASGGAWLNSVAFVDAEHGWAVGGGEAAVILATSDGGATWTAQDASGAGSADRLQSVSFVDAMHGWAVGGVEVGGAILATSDGGATWTRQRAGSANGQLKLNSVSFVDTARGWAVGVSVDTGKRVILATSDGGATWTNQDAGGDGQLNAVTFVDATHGWAVESNAVFATSNGGATWVTQDVDSVNLDSVTFPDATHGWAVGGNSMLTYDHTAAPPSVLSTIPSGVWPIGAAIIALAVTGGLGATLLIRRRRVTSVAAATRSAPDLPLPIPDTRRPSPAKGAGEKSWYCTACGSPVQAGSAFCGACGAKTAR